MVTRSVSCASPTDRAHPRLPASPGAVGRLVQAKSSPEGLHGKTSRLPQRPSSIVRAISVRYPVPTCTFPVCSAADAISMGLPSPLTSDSLPLLGQQHVNIECSLPAIPASVAAQMMIRQRHHVLPGLDREGFKAPGTSALTARSSAISPKMSHIPSRSHRPRQWPLACGIRRSPHRLAHGRSASVGDSPGPACLGI